ncbi:MAG TPA: ATPase, T2SS/T4P/T4SS family [Polyangiaceae bacterium]|jgi:pilus assembly protein CpaF|nr:ATPase, T2SS/T4P/T4SS family [Polyangiaceae bacterium]
MQLEVVIDKPKGAERRQVEAAGPLSIGRAEDCTLRIDSQLVSRRHVTLHLLQSAGRMRVVDSSRNGTLAGSLLLRNSEAEVPLGTRITVGDCSLELVPRSTLDVSLPEPSPLAVAAPAPAAALEPAPPSPAALEPPPSTARELWDEVRLRREIHRLLLEHLDLAAIDARKLDNPSLRPQVLSALRRIVAALEPHLPRGTDRDALVGEMLDEALGLGPLEQLIHDPSINEIMVVDPQTIYVEQRGKLTRSAARFTDDERVRAVIERIVTPLGRRIDESSPLVDARLSDGSRVNAVIRPLALRGSAITIRKFAKTPLTLDKLVALGALTEQMGRFLTRAVIAKKNIVIAGGTGSGKTTLLNVLSAAIPSDERIVTIEDAAELQLAQPHVVALETRPANMEGKGEYTIRDLVKNALRMRPDRIVVGECRGGEALDMLQAMNTGHDGSLTTTHANSAAEAVARLETLVLMAGLELPVRAIREQIAGAVHVLVQQARLSDGSRKVTAITELRGVGESGAIELLPLFRFQRTGTGPGGAVQGEFQSTGFLPSFAHEFQVLGLLQPGESVL